MSSNVSQKFLEFILNIEDKYCVDPRIIKNVQKDFKYRLYVCIEQGITFSIEFEDYLREVTGDEELNGKMSTSLVKSSASK